MLTFQISPWLCITWWPGAGQHFCQALLLAAMLFTATPVCAQLSEAGPPTMGAAAGLVSLSGPGQYDKYPAVTVDRHGRSVVVFTSLRNGRDQLYWRTLDKGGWRQAERVDAGQGVESHARLVTSGSSVWVFWQGRRHGRWAVYGRQRTGSTWYPEQQLSPSDQHAWHPQAHRDALGRVWLAWESVHGFSSRLVARVWQNSGWSTPTTIGAPGINRRLSWAAGPQGEMWLAYDAPTNGNYDIWLARLHKPIGSAPLRQDTLFAATHHGSLDDSPSLACGPDGTLWLAWNSLRGLTNETNRANRHAGGIYLRALRRGRWLSPPAPVPGLPAGQLNPPGINKSVRDAEEPYWHWKQTQNYPVVHLDGQQRLWVLWRTDPTGGHNFDL
jgi:hypothetical protein